MEDSIKAVLQNGWIVIPEEIIFWTSSALKSACINNVMLLISNLDDCRFLMRIISVSRLNIFYDRKSIVDFEDTAGR